MTSRILFLYLFLFLTSHIALWGQQPKFTNIQQKDGLSGNSQWSINSVAIDKKGFVWFATMEGLNRWDGYDVKSFTNISYNNRDLPNRALTAIAVDRNNNIWLGTQEDGIVFYDTKNEVFLPFDTKNLGKDSIVFSQINHLIIDENNKMYILTAFQGLFLYDIDKKVLTPYDSIIKRNKGGSFNSMLLTKDKKLVVAAAQAIYYIRSAEDYNVYPIFFEMFPRSIVELPDGTFYVTLSNVKSYYHLDPKSKTLKEHVNKIPHIAVNGIADNENNLWTSYLDGKLTKENIYTKQVVEYPHFTTMYGTQVTQSMLSIVNTNANKMYYMSIGSGAGVMDYAKKPITPFLTNGEGNLKIIDNVFYFTIGSTLYKLIDGNKTIVAQLPSDYKSNYIHDYHISKEHGIWISHTGRRGHLSNFDLNGKLKMPTLLSNGIGQFGTLPNKTIAVEMKSAYDSELGLPIEFIGKEYSVLSKKQVKDFRVKYYLISKNGDIWMATFNDGIYKVHSQDKKIEYYSNNKQNSSQLNSNNVYYLYEQSDGDVYVCTDIGISVWSAKSKMFKELALPKNIKNSYVFGMVEDKNQRIWMMLKDRLLCYEPSKNQFYSLPIDDDKQRESDTEDLVIDKEGFIYYIGYNGINKIEPALFFKTSPPNDVMITGLYVNRVLVQPKDHYNILDSSIILQNKIEVPYKYRDLGFSFVSIDGKDKDVSYFYRIIGYHDDWIEANQERILHFTNLDPGDYTFQVKAISGNGKETPSITELQIKVEPPWYQRWYAYLLYTIGISSLAYLTYRMRINQLLKYQSLRTKISSDLHDDVGTILSGIAMQSEMMSYEKEAEDKSLLMDLSTMSRDAMERMRDIVWALDARKDSYNDLVTRMREYAEMMLGKKGFEYNFNLSIGVGLKNINPEQRQNLYFIFKEAVANIVKHSNASKVDISIHKNSIETSMTIKDNGTNLNDTTSSGLGLSNIKMRAKRIGGEAMITTSDGYTIIVNFKS